ncbi:hypothetical protein BJ878DRAFT_478705 [Calycina marina]|uniref:Uncharacterized protein n=1 Tax=Calycina marina TaxID=1763456 RepID=A0A9P7Z600_9HELO|nr:hypothetical protein BJ878DRAFT_478705 [Calycina marina]
MFLSDLYLLLHQLDTHEQLSSGDTPGLKPLQVASSTLMLLSCNFYYTSPIKPAYSGLSTVTPTALCFYTNDIVAPGVSSGLYRRKRGWSQREASATVTSHAPNDFILVKLDELRPLNLSSNSILRNRSRVRFKDHTFTPLAFSNLGSIKSLPSSNIWPNMPFFAASLLKTLHEFDEIFNSDEPRLIAVSLNAEGTTDGFDKIERPLEAIRDMLENMQSFFGVFESSGELPAIFYDVQFLLGREKTQRIVREQLNCNASIMSLKESRLGIEQIQTVKGLTQLEFVFIPISFLTSVFRMNNEKLSGDGPKLWTVFIGVPIEYGFVAICSGSLSQKLEMSKSCPPVLGG